MANRLIKDAKDLNTNELIYFRGHAKATYMSNGSTVEDAINNINVGGGSISDMSNYYTKAQIDAKGYLTEHQDISGKQDTISDLETIRSGAEKGATALQTVPSEYVTETELNAKGYLTSHQDISGKQDKLVSGTNIKSINGTSILGEGDMKVGYKTISASTSTSMTLNPNIYYRNTSTSLTRLTITLNAETDSTILNEYLVEFTTRSAGTTVTLPSSVKWANGETPTFEASTTYQISIVNNLGIVTKFK